MAAASAAPRQERRDAPPKSACPGRILSSGRVEGTSAAPRRGSARHAPPVPRASWTHPPPPPLYRKRSTHRPASMAGGAASAAPWRESARRTFSASRTHPPPQGACDESPGHHGGWRRPWEPSVRKFDSPPVISASTTHPTAFQEMRDAPPSHRDGRRRRRPPTGEKAQNAAASAAPSARKRELRSSTAMSTDSGLAAHHGRKRQLLLRDVCVLLDQFIFTPTIVITAIK